MVATIFKGLEYFFFLATTQEKELDIQYTHDAAFDVIYSIFSGRHYLFGFL